MTEAPPPPPQSPSSPSSPSGDAAPAYGFGYGAPQGYAAPAYGSGYGAPQGYPPAPPPVPLAEWGPRALAYLIDVGIVLGGYVVVLVVAGILGQVADALGFVVLALGYIGVVGFAIWNQIIVQGRTGQSIGKRRIGITLVAEQTGAPIGPLLTFVRGLVHIVDALPCYVGFLWPLWDAKKQTFADKLMATLVVRR